MRRIVRLASRSENGSCFCGMLARKRSEHVTWTNLQQHRTWLLVEFGQAICKAYCATQMLSPIGGIGRLLGGDPVRSDIRKKRNLRRAQADIPEPIGERLQNRVHHGGMERVRCVKTTTGDTAVGQMFFELIDQIKRTGNDALVG